MKTPLDDGYTWFLSHSYYRDRELVVVVVEGLRASDPEDLHIGDHVLKGTYRIEPDDSSRRVSVHFEEPVAWQMVDESYTVFDEYEKREDEHKLQVITRSRYLDYVNQCHGWFSEIRGPAKHYRVWTEDEVIDVVCCSGPRFERGFVTAPEYWASFTWLLTELEEEDDPRFWEAAIDHIFADIDADCELAKKGVFAEVGRSSQWLRPHQTRWTADGGFAWPTGYGEASLTGSRVRGNPNAAWSASRSGLPAFDWFDRWARQADGTWTPSDPRERIKPRQFLVRIALPARTRRHQQGVVHSVWPLGHPKRPKEKVFRFYGFRNQDDEWNCTATHEFSG